MSRLGLLLLFTALVAARSFESNVPIPDGRIVGGKDANIKQYPHQITMRYRSSHRCGGSVYTPNIVVTAAHCVINTDEVYMTIVAGSTLLTEKSQELAVLQYFIHENYKTSNQDYDVAILVLAGRFILNEYVQPIALATARPPDGAELIVTGWGTLVQGGSIPNQLQQVNVNLVENSACRKSYPFLLTSQMLCAGVPSGGKDACQGDSGGPLIYNNTLLGIVSWGFGCARENFPGVYSSVPDLYKWIVNTTKRNEIQYT